MKIKLILVFSTLFFVFSIVGTILHELGHVAMAKYLDIDFTIHHNSVKLSEEFSKDYRHITDSINLNLNKKDSNYALNTRAQNIINTYREKSFLITLGGPLQTILTSIIGIGILTYRRYKNHRFSNWDFFAIFLALFISREAFLLVYDMVFLIFNHHYPRLGDEIKLGRLLNIHPLAISATLGIMAFYTCIWVVYKHLPKKHLYEFLIGGCIGGLTGFYFFNVWF